MPLSPHSPRARWAAAAAAVLAGALAVPFDPPWALLRSSPFGDAPAEGRVVFAAVGRTASVLVLEREEGFLLRSNGLPEAVVARRGAPPLGDRFEGWLTTLPAAARPAARSMLVVGLGGGTTLEHVPPWIERIDVVELEREVVRANRCLAALRGRDPLADPRVHLVLGDARGALARCRERWDVIVSQPSQPWTAGASHLYTRELVATAAEHLAPDGVFVQWMATAFLDDELLRSLVATLLAEFEHVRAYRPRAGLLVLLASPSAIDPEGVYAAGDPTLVDAWVELGVLCADDLVAALCLDGSAARVLAGDATPNTDDRNRLALRGPRLDATRTGPGIEAALAACDPLVGGARSPRLPPFDPAYVARRTAELELWTRAGALAAAIEDDAQRALAEGWIADAAGEPARAVEAWRHALRLAPRDPRAAYALVRPWLSALAEGRAPDEALAAAAVLPGPALAVVGGWSLSLAADWRALAALDERLAATRPADPWFDDATRLRAAWRSAVADPHERVARGREALALLDQVLARRFDPLALLTRAQAAAAAGDGPALVESAGALARRIDDPEDGLQAFLAAGLAALDPQLAALEERAGGGRVGEVRARIAERTRPAPTRDDRRQP